MVCWTDLKMDFRRIRVQQQRLLACLVMTHCQQAADSCLQYRVAWGAVTGSRAHCSWLAVGISCRNQKAGTTLNWLAERSEGISQDKIHICGAHGSLIDGKNCSLFCISPPNVFALLLFWPLVPHKQKLYPFSDTLAHTQPLLLPCWNKWWDGVLNYWWSWPLFLEVEGKGREGVCGGWWG